MIIPYAPLSIMYFSMGAAKSQAAKVLQQLPLP